MNDSDKTLHIQPPKYVAWAAIAALSMLALFLLVETIGALNNVDRSGMPATDTISVTGTGNAYASPDIATIDFTVSNTAVLVADAQSQTTKDANNTIAYLKTQGIADKDIRTTSYVITPQYSYGGYPCPAGAACPDYRSPKISGYEVSESVEVKLRQNLFDKVGDIVGGLGEHGVTNLYGPNFTLEDPNAPQNEARSKAIADAKAQAEELAKELGVRLVRIVNFSEGGNYPIMYAKDAAYGMGGATSASAPTPNLPTGQNEYTSNVSITYEIR